MTWAKTKNEWQAKDLVDMFLPILPDAARDLQGRRGQHSPKGVCSAPIHRVPYLLTRSGPHKCGHYERAVSEHTD